MKTRNFFVKGNQVVNIINGRYGKYANYYGNSSEKKMLGYGFEIKALTDDEVSNLKAIGRQELEAQLAKEQAIKLANRAQQVEICLNSEPLTVGDGNNLWTSVTNIGGGMEEAYHGCGQITAYISEGKIIAFHYGFEQPINVPVGAQPIQCEVSCHQILF